MYGGVCLVYVVVSYGVGCEVIVWMVWYDFVVLVVFVDYVVGVLGV